MDDQHREITDDQVRSALDKLVILKAERASLEIDRSSAINLEVRIEAALSGGRDAEVYTQACIRRRLIDRNLNKNVKHQQELEDLIFRYVTQRMPPE